jgi:hypothetical protein
MQSPVFQQKLAGKGTFSTCSSRLLLVRWQPKSALTATDISQILDVLVPKTLKIKDLDLVTILDGSLIAFGNSRDSGGTTGLHK